MKTLKVALYYLDFYPFLATCNYKEFQIFPGQMTSFYFGSRAAYLWKKNKITIEKDVPYKISDRNLIEGGFAAGIEYEFKQGINIGTQFTECLISTKSPTSTNYSCSNHTLAFVLGYTILKKKKE